MIKKCLAVLALTAGMGLAAVAVAQTDASPPPVPSGSLDAAPAAVDAAPADAAGADAPDADTGIGELLSRSYAAVEQGAWKHLVALVVLALVFFVRRSKGIRTWFKDRVGDDRGGVILVLFFSFAGALAHSVLAGADLLSLGPWQTAIQIGVEAIGGFVGFKKIVSPTN